MPPQRRRTTAAVIAAIEAVDPIARHERGESLFTIARAAGAPWLRVRLWLEAHGVDVRVNQRNGWPAAPTRSAT